MFDVAGSTDTMTLQYQHQVDGTANTPGGRGTWISRTPAPLEALALPPLAGTPHRALGSCATLERLLTLIKGIQIQNKCNVYVFMSIMSCYNHVLPFYSKKLFP